MKLGGRQSKNVDDIRKQKPKSRIGEYAFPSSEGFTGPLALKVTESRKKVKSIKQDLSSLAKKSGLGSMDSAADNDKQTRLAKEESEANMDKLWDDARKETRKGTYDFNKPKQLTEIWTPRPLKK